MGVGWVGDATVAGGAQQRVRSYSQAMCQLSLDHESASVVPGSVVLPKLGGDQSRMLGGDGGQCPLTQPPILKASPVPT